MEVGNRTITRVWGVESGVPVPGTDYEGAPEYPPRSLCHGRGSPDLHSDKRQEGTTLHLAAYLGAQRMREMSGTVPT